MMSNLALRLACLLLAFTSLTTWAANNDQTLELERTRADVVKAECQDYLTANEVQAFTLRTLREMAVKTINDLNRETPQRGFENWQYEAKNEQVGLKNAPLALQQILPPGVSFVSTPGATSPDPATIGATESSYSFPVHIDIDWHGQRSSTAAFITYRDSVIPRAGGYLITPDDGAVILHEHGGGTDKANSLNAVSLGEYEARYNIPLISVDLPGHGRGTANPVGLTSMEGQVDWYLEMIKKLVAPGTKRVGSGHSWGAEFATYMWLHSAEEKYKDYITFFPFAPPIDVSEGGDLQKKLDFGEELEQRYDELWDLAAPGDVAFLQNIYLKNKDPNVPGWFTGFSDLDYILPALTPEILGRLKPATTFLSQWDLITLVGREKQAMNFYGDMPVLVDENFDLKKFQSVFSNPNPGSEVYLFDKLATWHNTGPRKQGHQQFDAYIPGTEKPFVYEVVGMRTRALIGNPEIHKPAPFDILDYTFRNFANYAAFRELVKHDVEYVESMPAIENGARPFNLTEYIKSADTILKKSNDSVEATLRQSMDSLREQSGFRNSQTGELEKITYQRAVEELSAPPLTKERRAALETYLAAMRQVDQDLDGFRDPVKDAAIAALKAKHASTLKELNTTFENYKEAQKKLAAMKAPKEKGPAKKDPMEALRSDLSRMDQSFQDIIKEATNRKLNERTRLEKPIAVPAGITDKNSADRELNRVISPERTVALQSFVKAYEQLEAGERAKAASAAEAAIAALNRPAEIPSLEKARELEAQRTAIENLSFIPLGNTQIAAIVERFNDATRRKNELSKGDPSQNENKKSTAPEDSEKKQQTPEEREAELRNQLSKAIKSWATIWEPQEGQDKPALSNAALDAEMVSYNAALDRRTATAKAYETRKSDWILEHRRSGRPDNEILNFPDDLKKLLNERNTAMNAFRIASYRIEELRRREALAAPSSGPLAEAKALALAIFGKDYAKDRPSLDSLTEEALKRDVLLAESIIFGKPSSDSITSQLRVIEDYLEARRNEFSRALQEIAQYRYEYAQAITAAGYGFPKTIIRVPIFELLNRPLPELQAMLSANRDSTGAAGALKGLKKKWDGPDAMLTTLSQSKAKGSDGAY